jgi:hypothetical protein
MRKLSAWLFLSVLVGFVACKDDDDDQPANSITSEEAAVIASSSFSSNSSGINSVSAKSADEAADLAEANGRVAECGASSNIDFSASSPQGASITWSFDFSYKFRLNCNADNKPSTVTVDLNYSGDYSGPKLALDYSGIADWDLAGAEENVDRFLLTGLFKRSGSFAQKEGEKKSGSSNIEITLNDVILDKQTHEIISGTASFTLDGTIPDKGAYKYTGVATFQGNDTATLAIGGDNFTLNLETGDVTKK